MFTADTPVGTRVAHRNSPVVYFGVTVTPVDPDQRMVKVEWQNYTQWEFLEDLEIK